jgi:quinoprotein glucose dehydrogenase
LAAYAARLGISEALRAEALYGLSVWPEPSELDRVSGRYRGPFQNETAYAVRAIEPFIDDLLFDGLPAVQLAAVHAVRGLSYREANNHLAALLEEASSTTVRVAALEALYELDHAGMEEAFASALGDGDSRVRQAALGLLPESGIEGEVQVSLLSGVLETSPIDEQQVAIDVLGQVDHSSAHELLGDYLESLLAGDLAPELELEVVTAVEHAAPAELGSRLEAYYASRAEDPVARHGASLFGGDADRGRAIFYQHGGAQCVRCHIVDGSGSDVGPELTDAGSRLSREQLLESLVAPSERIAPGYGSVTLTLDDGATVQGVLEAETETTVTVRSGGELHEIPASRIGERVNAQGSRRVKRLLLEDAWPRGLAGSNGLTLATRPPLGDRYVYAQSP